MIRVVLQHMDGATIHRARGGVVDLPLINRPTGAIRVDLRVVCVRDDDGAEWTAERGPDDVGAGVGGFAVDDDGLAFRQAEVERRVG